jgi:hypothetical protein
VDADRVISMWTPERRSKVLPLIISGLTRARNNKLDDD